MTEQEIKEYICVRFPQENESCEWKEYKNLQNSLCGHEADDVVSYVSAISNMNGGSLIIGVKDQTLDIIGIQSFGSYNVDSAKARIAEKCRNLPLEDFDIMEFKADDTGRIVWVLNIPKHQAKLPVYAHNKAWQRTGDALVEMRPDRLQSILSEIEVTEDWSAAIVEDATIDDLDSEAIERARKEFIKRNPLKKDEVKTWDDAKFLDKAKITLRGKITRAALILLGKEEAEFLLSPYVVKIRWSLRHVGETLNKDYDIFSIPFLLSVDKLYNKVRNVKYRIVRPNSLFPDEMLRYDMFNIREPLNNAIAHQDYTKCARIDVVEYEDDHLIFQNYGSFLPTSIEDVVEEDCPQSIYRNRFLVEAMRNLNMIETEGGGIRKLFLKQSERYFPLPDYDLSGGKVKVTIEGNVKDENFAKILAANPNLELADIVLLDKVQKRMPIDNEPIKYLRSKHFIEGRKPNLFLAYEVVTASKNSDLKTQYVKNRSFDDDYFRKLILNYIDKFGIASRKEINLLLKDKLSDLLSKEQKMNKIDNLIRKLRVDGKIVKTEDKQWKLA